MALTINAKAYTADTFNGTSVTYQGPNQSTSAKDKLVVKRTDPKPTADFSGVNRHESRFQRTVALTGAKTQTAEVQVKYEVISPVGISDADRDSIVTDSATWFATAGYKAMVKSGQING